VTLDDLDLYHQFILVKEAISIYHQPLCPLLVLGLKYFVILLSPMCLVLVARFSREIELVNKFRLDAVLMTVLLPINPFSLVDILICIDTLQARPYSHILGQAAASPGLAQVRFIRRQTRFSERVVRSSGK
jgi:hypothetical protein